MSEDFGNLFGMEPDTDTNTNTSQSKDALGNHSNTSTSSSLIPAENVSADFQRQEQENPTIANEYRCGACGVVLTPKNWRRSCSGATGKRPYYRCKKCLCEYQREWKAGSVTSIAIEEAREEGYAEQRDRFDAYWNDPELVALPYPTRLMETFKKNGIRGNAEVGIELDPMIEVIVEPELANFNAGAWIDQFLKQNNLTGAFKNRISEYLNRAFYNELIADLLNRGLKDHNRNKVHAMIDQANDEYKGQEEIISEPAYKNPKTRRREHRYRLLSKRDDLNKREGSREAKKFGFDRKTQEETKIVEKQEATPMNVILEKERIV